MGTLGNPKTWTPYMNTKDCTKGFCSIACPQWCYIIFSPPPPSTTTVVFTSGKSQTTTAFSPLVIAIIGVLASAFLLVSYYAIISKYCGKQQSQQPPPAAANMNEDMMDEELGHDHNHHQAWLVSTPGLDEALIKAITLVKYHKGDGLVGSNDCSVCLGEFLENDSLRLLPKCSHAFHVACVDTWLKSHSNCPLCRSNIISSFAPPLPSSPPPPPSLPPHVDHHDETQHSNEEGENTSGQLPKCLFRALSDLGELGLRNIVASDHNIMRSISMDHSHETRVSVSEILRMNQRNEDHQLEKCQLNDQSMKGEAGESSKKSDCTSTSSGGSDCCSNRNTEVLQYVMSSNATKKSFPSGRFLFGKHGKGSNAVLPL